MTDGQSPNTGRKPQTIAQRLLSTARKNPTLRAHLIERWARAETWTVVEGVALAWTIDPSKLKYTGGMLPTVGGLPDEAKHYLELARRSGESRSRTPSSFIQWAHGVGLAFHSEWHKSVGPARPPRERARMSEAADRKRERLIRLWAPASYWSPTDGVALAYGLDPKDAVKRPAAGYDNPGIEGPADARHLLELAYRAVAFYDLDEMARPAVFLRWAQSVGVEFHPDWWAAVKDDKQEARNELTADPQELASLDLKSRERDSLLKMIIGMAVQGYCWNPKSQRNISTKEIADDLAKCGVPLDHETIVKWLRRGAELLPATEP